MTNAKEKPTIGLLGWLGIALAVLLLVVLVFAVDPASCSGAAAP